MIDAGKKTKSTYLKNFEQNKALRTRDASDETLKYPNFGRREIRVNVDLFLLVFTRFHLDSRIRIRFRIKTRYCADIHLPWKCQKRQVILQQDSEFSEERYNNNTSIEWTLMSVINDPPRTMELL